MSAAHRAGYAGRARARWATSPSCSASPTGAPPTSCSRLHQELAGSAGGRDERARAARARRARPGPRPARGDDVEGHAAAARARAGADRRAAAAAARRADERARPGRPPHRAHAARAAARARRRRAAQLAPAVARSSWSATASRSSTAARSSPPARRPSSAAPAASRSRPRPARGRFPAATREDAPQIVRELVATGEDVFEVRVLHSTLEDAYLEAVGRTPAPGREEEAAA